MWSRDSSARKKALYVTLMGGAACVLVAFVSPVGATPIVETYDNLAGLEQAVLDSNNADILSDDNFDDANAQGGLVFTNNISGAEIGQIADVNERLLGQQVDALGKIGPDNGGFESFLGGTILDGALSIDCLADKCATFEWAFDQSFTTLAVEWDIIKIGVKYGDVNAFFLIGEDDFETDEDGVDRGTFDLYAYGPEEGLYETQQAFDIPLIWDETHGFGDKFTGGPNAGTCKKGFGPECEFWEYKLAGGLSHIDFFGTPDSGQVVPEPATLALLGLGLVGLGLARRRKAA